MFHNIDQVADEDIWLPMRAGKVTGSKIGKIMANYGKAFGDPAKKLIATIACEQVTGKLTTSNDYKNDSMERGKIQEPMANRLYEDTYFVTVENGGFFDNGNTGCSPDGRILPDGINEIKSVLAHVHYANIKRAGLDPAYKWQFYFNLKESGAQWLDFVSYCADFPPETRLFVHRIYRDNCTEEFNMIDSRLKEFFTEVEKAKLIIKGEAA